MTMSLSGLLLLIVIAAVCGAVGKAIAGSARGGLIVSIALGFIGTLLGSWVARLLKLEKQSGVVLSDIMADSPAARAGLQEGDIGIGVQRMEVACRMPRRAGHCKTAPARKRWVARVEFQSGKRR